MATVSTVEGVGNSDSRTRRRTHERCRYAAGTAIVMRLLIPPSAQEKGSKAIGQ
jgi:hypothetical protein